MFKLFKSEVQHYSKNPYILLSLIGSLIVFTFWADQVYTLPVQYLSRKISVEDVVTSYLIFIMSLTGLLILPQVLINYRKHNLLKRYQLTSLSKTSIASAIILSSYVVTLIVIILFMILGVAIYDLNFYGEFISLIPMLIICFSIVALGLLLCSLISNDKHRNTIAVVLMLLLQLPMVSNLTSAILINKKIIDILPTSYYINSLNSIWFGHATTEYLLELSTSIIIILVSLFVFVKHFKWDKQV